MRSEKCDVLICDGRHCLYRATDKHQMLSTDVNGTDVATGGVYGFLNIMIRTHALYGGQVIVAWEGLRNDNFRLKLYPAYKNRNEELTVEKQDFIDEIGGQEQLLKAFLKHMGVRQYSAIGGEADDVIGRLSTHMLRRGNRVYIYSGDSDLRQLVQEHGSCWIKTVSPNKGARSRGGDKVYGVKEVFERHGVPPSLIADLKALSGDNSDNIPGAPGVGDVTAAKLLTLYGDLNNVLAAATHEDDRWPVAPRFMQIIAEHAPILSMYRMLTGLKLDVAMTSIKPERSQGALVELLKTYRFRSMMHAAELQALMKMGGT